MKTSIKFLLIYISILLLVGCSYQQHREPKTEYVHTRVVEVVSYIEHYTYYLPVSCGKTTCLMPMTGTRYIAYLGVLIDDQYVRVSIPYSSASEYHEGQEIVVAIKDNRYWVAKRIGNLLVAFRGYK